MRNVLQKNKHSFIKNQKFLFTLKFVFLVKVAPKKLIVIKQLLNVNHVFYHVYIVMVLIISVFSLVHSDIYLILMKHLIIVLRIVLQDILAMEVKIRLKLLAIYLQNYACVENAMIIVSLVLVLIQINVLNVFLVYCLHVKENVPKNVLLECLKMGTQKLVKFVMLIVFPAPDLKSINVHHAKLIKYCRITFVMINGILLAIENKFLLKLDKIL